MSIVDKIPSRCASGTGIDPALPEWKRDLILRKRAMNRTFPLRFASVAVNEHPRSRLTATGHEEDRRLDECLAGDQGLSGGMTSVRLGSGKPVPFVALTAEEDTREQTSLGHALNYTSPPLNVETISCDLLDASRAWPVGKKPLGAGTNSVSVLSRNEIKSVEHQKRGGESLPSSFGIGCSSGTGYGGECNRVESKVATRTRTSSDLVKMGEDKGNAVSSNNSNGKNMNTIGIVSDIGLTSWPVRDSRSPVVVESSKDGDDESAFEKCRENEQEYEYGPGIVNRLRSKFIQLTLRDGAATNVAGSTPFVPIRRVASLEHLLDSDAEADTEQDDREGEEEGNQAPCCLGRRRYRRNRHLSWGKKTSMTSPRAPGEVMKRARSMETLSVVDRGGLTTTGYGGFKNTFFRGFSRDYMVSSATFPPLSPVNDNVIIIEQSKPSKVLDDELAEKARLGSSVSKLRVAQDVGRKNCANSVLDDDELPKPDTVRTYKKLFENSGLSTEDGGFAVKKEPQVGQVRKVTPPPKPPGLRPGPKPNIPAKPTHISVPLSPSTVTPAKLLFRALEKNQVEKDRDPKKELDEPLQDHQQVNVYPHSPTSTSCFNTLLNGLVNGEKGTDTGPLKATVQDGSGLFSRSDSTEMFNSDSQVHSVSPPFQLSVDSSTKDGLFTKVQSEPDDPQFGESSEATADVGDAVAGASNDAPKVVSFQPKTEEKDHRPVGHIRPFSKVEDRDVNNSPEASASDVLSQDELLTTSSPKPTFLNRKAHPPPSHGPVTQTFNFVGNTQVQAHIPNHTTPFDFRRPRAKDKVITTNKENLNSVPGSSFGSYIIVDDDRMPFGVSNFSDEEDGDEIGSGEDTSYEFVGDNIVAGRSALIKTRNKKVNREGN